MEDYAKIAAFSGIIRKLRLKWRIEMAIFLSLVTCSSIRIGKAIHPAAYAIDIPLSRLNRLASPPLGGGAANGGKITDNQSPQFKMRTSYLKVFPESIRLTFNGTILLQNRGKHLPEPIRV
jgi:hypothetical protein